MDCVYIYAKFFYRHFSSLFICLIFFYSQRNLQKATDNLTNYIKFESSKFCQKCHIVEPSKMVPTYGNQKLTHLTDCICTKGKYFVPMVFFLLFLLLHVPIQYIYIYILLFNIAKYSYF